MADTTSCINNILPSEILQQIFLFSAQSFHDALKISTVCRLWRKIILNPVMIERYWLFDNEHRRKGLVRWWNFNEHTDDRDNDFVHFPMADCFLGKCVSLAHRKKNSEEVKIGDSQHVIDRGSNYTIAFWLLMDKPIDESYCVFMVADDDWDYARSAGLVIEENFFSIAFSSCIGGRSVKSNVQIKLNEWFFIVLVQERESDKQLPRQNLWINGKLELTVEVPVAAFSNTANVSFHLWNEWTRSIADISIWSRCLLPLEIRAIYEQKTLIDKVNIAKFICEHLHK